MMEASAAAKKILRDWPYYGVLVLVAWFCFSNVSWLAADQTPVEWDDGWNLLVSNYYYRRFLGQETRTLEELKNTYQIVLHAISFYPPFYRLSSVPLYLLFGFSPDVGTLTNLMFYLLLVYSVCLLAVRMAGGQAALLASLIVSTSPLLVGISRHYLLDFPLTALVFAGILFYLRSENFTSRWNTILFFIAAGLGTMTKLQYPALVLPPILLLFVFKNWRSGFLLNMEQVVNIARGVCVYLVIALPWIAYNVDGIGRGVSIYVKWNGGLDSLLFYGGQVVNGASLFYFLLFCLSSAAIVAGIAAKKRFEESDVISCSMIILVPFLVFIYSAYTTVFESRFILPAIPAIAVVCARGVSRVRDWNPMLGAAVFTVVVAFGILQVAPYAIDYGVPAPNLAWETSVVNISALPQASRYLFKPGGEDWSIKDILLAIREDVGRGGGGLRRACVGAVLPQFNDVNFQMYAYWYDVPTSYLSLCPANYAASDYVIAKEGEAGRSSLNGIAGNITEDSRYSEIKAFKLPDGSFARVYKRKTAAKPA